MAYWHFVSPLGWPGFHPHRSIFFCLLSDLGLNFKLDTNNVSFQTAAVTGLVWLFLGGFHTLYLVYATGWRDFQIVIR